jgi:hypothetical protein
VIVHIVLNSAATLYEALKLASIGATSLSDIGFILLEVMAATRKVPPTKKLKALPMSE